MRRAWHHLYHYGPSIYPNDFFITVSDDIAEVFHKSENAENTYRKKAKQGVLFAGCRPRFVVHILESEPSPIALYEQKMALYRAMEHRLKSNIEHIFQHMSIADIARIEGIEKSSVQYSIEQALKIISAYLNDNI